MKHLGNGLYVSHYHEDVVQGNRDTKEATHVNVKFREHEGTVTIIEGEWPEDGVEWNVCPSEWESLESDIQDYALDRYHEK